MFLNDTDELFLLGNSTDFLQINFYIFVNHIFLFSGA